MYIGCRAQPERREKAGRSLITVIIEGEIAVPIGHEPIYDSEQIIGHTPSASFGYRIGKPIALAHIHSDNPYGLEVEVDISGTRFKARTQFAPDFDPEGQRMKI